MSTSSSLTSGSTSTLASEQDKPRFTCIRWLIDSTGMYFLPLDKATSLWALGLRVLRAALLVVVSKHYKRPAKDITNHFSRILFRTRHILGVVQWRRRDLAILRLAVDRASANLDIDGKIRRTQRVCDHEEDSLRFFSFTGS